MLCWHDGLSFLGPLQLWLPLKVLHLHVAQLVGGLSII